MNHLDKLIERYPALESCREQIQSAFTYLKETYQRGGMLLICGNGGSAADSEHIVGELMKEFARKRPLTDEQKQKLLLASKENGEMLSKNLQRGLPAITLTSNISLSTAFANDAAPELVFAQQVFVYGSPLSTFMGISTSGNSKNVVYAAETAKALGLKTIGLTGSKGGKLKEICDVCISVPSNFTPEIQELHLPVYHTLCLMIEDEFFGLEK